MFAGKQWVLERETEMRSKVVPWDNNQTGNRTSDGGASALSAALKDNTTLTSLQVSCEHQHTHTHEHEQRTEHKTLSSQTAYCTGNEGEHALCEALQSNTTLAQLVVRK